MLRRCSVGLCVSKVASGTSSTSPATPGAGTHMNTQQTVLEINSPMSLLRMCYRSIDITVKSRHARNFLKKRLVEQWAEKSTETDPQKQRFYMDLAGSFLQALHSDRHPKPGVSVTFQLSRRVAYEQKLAEQESRQEPRRRRRVPKDAKVV